MTEPIALVGMAGVFPGAPNINALWRASLEGRVSLTEAPPSRLPLELFDPLDDRPGRFYTRRGGFIDAHARFNPSRYGVMPTAAQGAEPDQLMTLRVCAEALRDAGYDPLGGASRKPLTSRAEVILGRGGYIGPAMSNLNLRVRTLEQLDLTLSEVSDLTEAQRGALRASFEQKLERYGPDTAIGLVPNLCAARVAQRFNFTGSAYTLDAACASSLIAVERACESLRSGRADLALAGGVHLVHDLTFWSVFTQLGALSRSSSMRPFDARADGLLIGEGLGVVALKRYSDAVREGDRIYAVVRGAASASDGRAATLMSPDSRGQLAALERAWAGLDPRELGLLEAHATATPLGDRVELESIRRFFGARGEGEPVVFGTLKALIGHTMPASGIAALMRASLALYHGVLPPSGDTSAPFEPHEALEEGRLERLNAPQAWPVERARRAAVNAFGFGGSDAHVVLDAVEYYEREPQEGSAGASGLSLRRHRALAALPRAPQHLLALAAPTQEALSALIKRWAERLTLNTPLEAERAHLVSDSHASRELTQHHREGEGAHRVALLDPTPKRLLDLERAVLAGKAKRGRGGVWHTPTSSLTSPLKVAFLYPGVEASFSPDIDELCAHFGLPLPPLSARREERGATLTQEELARRGVEVVRLNLTLTSLLHALKITPNHIAGHSVGEWAGLVSAGYLSEEHVERFIGGLDPQGLEVPEVSFLSVGASRERAEALLAGEEGVCCSHDNCPHQSVFCVPRERAEVLAQHLIAQQALSQVLPFESGFHAPYFEGYAARITAHLRDLPLTSPHTPLWSATTCALYPAPTEQSSECALTPEMIEELCVLSDRHLTEPVRFRPLIERLYEEGVRCFVQVGVGSLTSFVSDTLRGREHLALSAHSEQLSGREQITRLCAALFVEGLNPHLTLLNPLGVPERRDMRLKLGVPLISLSEQERAEVRGASQVSPSEPKPSEPKLSERAPSDVGAWRGVGTLPSPLKRPQGQDERAVWRGVWRLSVAEMPYLTDHCFFRQPQGWPILRDRFPVVPMTLSVQWVMEAAQAMVNARGLEERVVGVAEVRASKWVEVEPALEVEVEARPSPDLSQALTFGELRRVKVTLKGHLSAVVLLSAQPLAPPASPFPQLPHERPAPISAAQVYQDRWMFHGPQYEGIACLDALSPKGIRGLLRTTSTPGALLDNVGQLFGLWVMLTEAEDRVVMPVSIDELMIYGPPPVEGELLSCTVWIERLERRDVVAHICVWREGRLWATIKGWRDWRFETSGALWSLMRYPERSLYASPLALPSELSDRVQQGGLPSSALSLTLAEGVSSSASSREFLVGRCLNQEEQVTYRAAPARAQQSWLAGRIAAKDAARALRWRAQHAQGALPSPLFPIEVSTAREEGGALCFTAEGAGAPFNASITHKGGSALAAACPRALAQLGVDMEPVVAREEAWREASFCPRERALIETQLTDVLRALESRAPHPSLALRLKESVWTAAWCVKEARAKASRAGLGAPKQWLIEALSLSVTPQGISVEAKVRGQAQRADQPSALCVAWSVTLSGASTLTTPALAALCVLPTHQPLPPPT